jgi:hypothetical protein
MFLARELLGYSLVSEKYHRVVAEHYVQKDPDLPIADQNPFKSRLHLDPRGTFKSTMNMADTVQWIICFPDIAILLLSASSALTKGFVSEVSRHFILPKGATPSLFQELFPEYTITPKQALAGSYTAPCRATGRKEETLMASSIESSLSGWHFDVLKEDDIVDNRNSETPAGIAKVKKNRHINRKMLMPWGYRDTAGTRYDPFDAYGDEIANTEPAKLKMLIRPALRLLDGTRLTPMRFPEPEEMELVFPELLSYDFLRNDYLADYQAFQTQYMNDAHGGRDIVFDPEDMRHAWVSEDEIAPTGDAHIAWRFVCKSKDGMRYAGAAVGRVDRGRTFIIDTERGIFPPTTLANRVVELAKKHYVHHVSIEMTPGAQYMQRHIENAMVAKRWEVQIAWLEHEQDDGARDLRMKSLEPLVSGRRLFFARELPHARDLMRQFGNYGMVEDTELVDTVARVCEEMPGSIALAQSEQADEFALQEMVERDRYNRVYGFGHGPSLQADFEDELPEAQTDCYEPQATEGEICPGLGI